MRHGGLNGSTQHSMGKRHALVWYIWGSRAKDPHSAHSNVLDIDLERPQVGGLCEPFVGRPEPAAH
jgi:hypothetical protein